MKKKEDPTCESLENDATLEVYAFPKGTKSDAIHICDMHIPLTGPNVWKKNHLLLREPDIEILDAIVAELKAEPSFTNNWWKIWILLQFEEKQVDTEKVKQDWPAITELLLNKWFDQNIDSRDRGIATLIHIFESLSLDQALVKLITQLGRYKFKLLDKTYTPRELDLLFHWVTNTKMTVASFRRKATEPPVLWPLSDQFLLYLNEYLDPELLMEMGANLEVEDNVMHSINGEENITDPRYKTFKVLIKSRQKKDQVVGFTLLLTEMVKARHQVEACHYLVRETRRWMASIIDTQPETCTKLENVLQLV